MRQTWLGVAMIGAMMLSTPAVAGNLIRNSGFESWDAKHQRFFSWWGCGNANPQTGSSKDISMSSNALKGKGALQIVNTRQADGSVKRLGVYQGIKITPGKYRLEITGKVKGQGNIWCTWSFKDAQRKNIKVKNYWTKKNLNSATWNKLSEVIEVPANATILGISIYFSLNQKDQSGTAWVDEVSLTPVK